MNKWSGRQKNVNHPFRIADRKTNLKKQHNIWNLWDNIKCANLCIIRGFRGEKRERGTENSKS